MQLYDPAAYKKIRNHVRKNGGTRFWRRLEAWWSQVAHTQNASVFWTIALPIMVLVRLNDHPKLCVFLVMLISMGYTLRLTQALLDGLQYGADHKALVYLPISDRHFFHYQWAKLQRNWKLPALVFAILHTFFAIKAGAGWMLIFSGWLLAVVQGLGIVALAGILAAAIPNWPIRVTSGLMIQAGWIALILGRALSQFELETKLYHAALIFPSAWITYAFNEGILNGNLLGIFSVLPFAGFWIGMEIGGRWMRNEYVMPPPLREHTAETVLQRALDSVIGKPDPRAPELETLKQEPEREVAREELRKEWQEQREKNISESLNSSTLGSEKNWGPFERLLMRWYSPRERTLFEFLYPQMPKITRDLCLSALAMITLFVLLHFFTQNPLVTISYWCATGMLSVLHLGIRVNNRAQGVIPLGTRFTMLYAFFPAGFDELYRTKYKYAAFRFALWTPFFVSAFAVWNVEFHTFQTFTKEWLQDGLILGLQLTLDVFILGQLIHTFGMMGNMSEHFHFTFKTIANLFYLGLMLFFCLGTLGCAIWFLIPSGGYTFVALASCIVLCFMARALARYKYHSRYYDLVGLVAQQPKPITEPAEL